MKSSLDAKFFANNRKRLMEALPADALVVIAGHGEMQQAHDMAYGFEQEASFWYLTGIDAPDWQAIIDGKAGRTILISPEASDTREIFDGLLDADVALAISGADEVVLRNEGLSIMQRLVAVERPIYSLMPDKYVKKYSHFTLNPAPLALIRKLKKMTSNLKDCRREVQKLRTIKQGIEIAEISAAIDATGRAFEAVYKNLQSLDYEYQVEALMTYEIRRGGSKGHAYTPIVASGQNACTLHYTKNNSKLSKSDLLLIDVGARSRGGYAADVTRTLSVGRPSNRQRIVWSAVHEAQQRCIELIKPGLGLAEYHAKTETIMSQAVFSIGFEKNELRNYFPHAIGHGLGIDVHDSLAGYDSFQAGMVLTVEPGIYIPSESLGVRIEDDILVTETGSRNLSGDIPVELS